jgi:hypothetical protein
MKVAKALKLIFVVGLLDSALGSAGIRPPIACSHEVVSVEAAEAHLCPSRPCFGQAKSVLSSAGDVA